MHQQWKHQFRYNGLHHIIYWMESFSGLRTFHPVDSQLCCTCAKHAAIGFQLMLVDFKKYRRELSGSNLSGQYRDDLKLKISELKGVFRTILMNSSSLSNSAHSFRRLITCLLPVNNLPSTHYLSLLMPCMVEGGWSLFIGQESPSSSQAWHIETNNHTRFKVNKSLLFFGPSSASAPPSSSFSSLLTVKCTHRLWCTRQTRSTDIPIIK